MLANRTTGALRRIAEVQGFHGFAIRESTRPEVLQDPGSGLSQLTSLMEIFYWQNEQGRCFLHEDPHHSWSRSTKALRTLESLSGVRATKTKQFGTFMTNCPPIKFYKSWKVVDFICHVSSERSATNTGGGHWSHRQYQSWTDCGRGVPRAEVLHMNLDEPQTTKTLDCHWTPSWWLMPSRRVEVHS